MVAKTSLEYVYSVRVNPRAKHMRLYISEHSGLEVVLPRPCNKQRIDKFVAEHHAWISKHQTKLLQYQARQQARSKLPTCIDLSALQQKWSLHYQFVENRQRVYIKQMPDRLLVTSPFNAQESIIKQLVNWLKQKARLGFHPHLEALSRQMQLPFKSYNISQQKTCWGTCNHHAEISLNYKLLFMPERLVRYVMIHELCHTRHLNHSKNFWTLVEFFDDNYREHKKELRQAEQYIPLWLP